MRTSLLNEEYLSINDQISPTISTLEAINTLDSVVTTRWSDVSTTELFCCSVGTVLIDGASDNALLGYIKFYPGLSLEHVYTDSIEKKNIIYCREWILRIRSNETFAEQNYSTIEK